MLSHEIIWKLFIFIYFFFYSFHSLSIPSHSRTLSLSLSLSLLSGLDFIGRRAPGNLSLIKNNPWKFSTECMHFREQVGMKARSLHAAVH